MWYCVTITNPACKKWDGTTEDLVTSFSSEADCVSYAKKIAHKVHTSLHFDLIIFAVRAFRQSRIRQSPPIRPTRMKGDEPHWSRLLLTDCAGR